MNDGALSATQIFEALLSDPAGKKIFMDAVHSAFLEKHKSSERAYNIDEIGRLAAAVDSHHYAARKMVGVRRFANRNQLLSFSAASISVEGPIMEFGVWAGWSINLLATALPSRTLYGFDSFEGLPESWFGKGAGSKQFSLDGKLPQVAANVELVVGWFDQVLPAFMSNHAFKAVALLHVDCDLYSSTATILNSVHSRIVPGTIILFDEYFNYPTWQRHEFAAFQDYVTFRQIKYEYIGLVPSDGQVAVRILAT